MAASKSQNAFRSIHILLVEDNPGDVLLTQEALADARLVNTLTTLSTGSDALAYLRRQPPHQKAMPADLVILDLNLPGPDGRQVLMMMKADPELKNIPVIVLTGSREKKDVVNAYSLAECYLTKPVSGPQILEFVMARPFFRLMIVAVQNSSHP